MITEVPVVIQLAEMFRNDIHWLTAGIFIYLLGAANRATK